VACSAALVYLPSVDSDAAAAPPRQAAAPPTGTGALLGRESPGVPILLRPQAFIGGRGISQQVGGAALRGRSRELQGLPHLSFAANYPYPKRDAGNSGRSLKHKGSSRGARELKEPPWLMRVSSALRDYQRRRANYRGTGSQQFVKGAGRRRRPAL